MGMSYTSLISSFVQSYRGVEEQRQKGGQGAFRLVPLIAAIPPHGDRCTLTDVAPRMVFTSCNTISDVVPIHIPIGTVHLKVRPQQYPLTREQDNRGTACEEVATVLTFRTVASTPFKLLLSPILTFRASA